MRGKLIPFTDDDKKAITKKYREGVGVAALGREYHCANIRIHAVLRDAGVRAKGAEFTSEHRKDIADRYSSGEDVLSIAKSYRCRYYVMRDLIESLGVEKRVITTTNTPVGCRLHDVLKKYGIGFTTQVRLVDRYVVDIKINQAPVVIEADGKTFHSYERDVKRGIRHKEAGYSVFRFTGSEINSNADKCIRHVIEECDLVADEHPIYDIRTTFSGPDHPRWVERLFLTCLNCDAEFEVAQKRRYRKFCKLSCYHEYIRRTGVFKGGRKSIERPD